MKENRGISYIIRDGDKGNGKITGGKQEMKEFKGVWHKVADGDFPELEELVLIACRIEDGDLETTIGYLREYNVYKTWQIRDEVIGTRKGWVTIDHEIFRLNEVVAWMELPEYEE